MSYEIEWVAEARESWRALDISAQEDVLDELDRITATDAATVRQSGVVDLIAGDSSTRTLVFLQLAVHHKRKSIIVVNVTPVRMASG